eukprot:TRINITY_DN6590_c0_g1_i1.p1 TRINITY_DN6590_c0_g1~~TRINITY_DN6590_c0_g1_i1.p1  ORF type:complete len:591 (-),score=99.41 TRINITY_DN6590_c0_g1_i1:194-1966(-)
MRPQPRVVSSAGGYAGGVPQTAARPTAGYTASTYRPTVGQPQGSVPIRQPQQLQQRPVGLQAAASYSSSSSAAPRVIQQGSGGVIRQAPTSSLPSASSVRQPVRASPSYGSTLPATQPASAGVSTASRSPVVRTVGGVQGSAPGTAAPLSMAMMPGGAMMMGGDALSGGQIVMAGPSTTAGPKVSLDDLPFSNVGRKNMWEGIMGMVQTQLEGFAKTQQMGHHPAMSMRMPKLPLPSIHEKQIEALFNAYDMEGKGFIDRQTLKTLMMDFQCVSVVMMSKDQGKAKQEALQEMSMMFGPQMGQMMSGAVQQGMDMELCMMAEAAKSGVPPELLAMTEKDLGADLNGNISKASFMAKARGAFFDPNPPEEILQAAQMMEQAMMTGLAGGGCVMIDDGGMMLGGLGGMPGGAIMMGGGPMGGMPGGAIMIGDGPMGGMPGGAMLIGDGPMGGMLGGAMLIGDGPMGGMPGGAILIGDGPMGGMPGGAMLGMPMPASMGPPQGSVFGPSSMASGFHQQAAPAPAGAVRYAGSGAPVQSVGATRTVPSTISGGLSQPTRQQVRPAGGAASFAGQQVPVAGARLHTAPAPTYVRR